MKAPVLLLASIFFLNLLHMEALQNFNITPYYKSLTLKTNLLSVFNLSLECPVYKGLTLEASGRYFAIGNLPGDEGGFSGDNVTTSFRLNAKYHFDLYQSPNSVYVYTGINVFNKTRYKYEDEYYYDKYVQHMTRAVAGIGTKRKVIDCWVAVEYPVLIFDNSSGPYSYGNNIQGPRTVRPVVPSISAGFALNLFNAKI